MIWGATAPLFVFLYRFHRDAPVPPAIMAET
ncbi:hypothetical protein BMIN10S_00442 [Bosea minatitlanensis]